MSIAYDCPACCMGRHGQHDADWGVAPGLIGGTHCDCPGDCEARFAAAVRELRERLTAPAPARPGVRPAGESDGTREGGK